jgi:hypothetical protein
MTPEPAEDPVTSQLISCAVTAKSLGTFCLLMKSRCKLCWNQPEERALLPWGLAVRYDVTGDHNSGHNGTSVSRLCCRHLANWSVTLTNLNNDCTVRRKTVTRHALLEIFRGFHGGDYEERRLLGYKNPVHTSQETHYVSATESSRLMLCNIWGFHGGDYDEFSILGYKNPDHTSEETCNFSATEPSRLMLCKIWGFDGGDYDECRLLGCYAVWPRSRHSSQTKVNYNI